ncbi:MAG: transglutaminase family protein [Verrucomicrobiota bacterium JB023]|nr:transglutaminase family protein [Verrucomicrobiota bacterium JB023]
MSDLATLPYLLRLLDDEEPTVRSEIKAQLSHFGGDLSDHIAGLGIDLSPQDREVLSQILLPARRKALREAWFAPGKALDHADGDWDLLESFLRLLSDYLHDGVSLRASLSDALDDWAEESASLSLNEPLLVANWLFDGKRLRANRKDYYNPRNSDLAEVLETGVGNPLSLSLILILIAQRREMPVFGCNYPGHFLCWLDTADGPQVIDPYNKARMLPVKQIVHNNPGLSNVSRETLAAPCSQLDILKRMLSNLSHSFTKINSPEDAELVRELLDSLDEPHDFDVPF